MDQMVSNSIDLVFADPPFNLGKYYRSTTFNDTLKIEEYRRWCQAWVREMVRILRPGGALFVYHWPRWLIEFGQWLNGYDDVEYRSWIALKMKSGFPIRNRLHPAHYGILYYTKRGAKHKFNVVRAKTPVCRHCGNEIRDYGGYRTKFQKYEDEDGVPWVQISDFWEDTRPARQDKSRQVQVVELPLHIPERVILMASDPGDIVLDVFGGSGSTYHAAQLHQRRWIGCEVGDVTTILRRMETVFKLNPVKSMSHNLRNCFRSDFIHRELSLYNEGNSIAKLREIKPFDSVVGSFQEYASKSRIIEASTSEESER